MTQQPRFGKHRLRPSPARHRLSPRGSRLLVTGVLALCFVSLLASMWTAHEIAKSGAVDGVSAARPVLREAGSPDGAQVPRKPIATRGARLNPPLSTDGAQIVDSTGAPVRLTGINWFGAETENQVVHGLWSRPYTDLIDQVVDLGFNTIRLPYSNDMLRDAEPVSGIDFGQNPQLAGSAPLQVMDKIIDYAGEAGLVVILDRHQPSAEGQSALWWTDEVSEEVWIEDWVFLAQRYADDPWVIGADLDNEPHNDPEGSACWACGEPDRDWHAAAERAGAAIQEENEDWLILVQGVQSVEGSSDTWWGGNLSRVAQTPVELPVANKVVYSPHEYGTSMYEQDWLVGDGSAQDLPARWDEQWGYLIKGDIAPVLVGEFGSTLEDPRDQQWMDTLLTYLGEGPSGASFMYSSLNPNSAETGGILQDDWTSVADERYAALAPYLGGPLTKNLVPRASTSR